jgi:hypothetical protein
MAYIVMRTASKTSVDNDVGSVQITELQKPHIASPHSTNVQHRFVIASDNYSSGFDWFSFLK